MVGKQYHTELEAADVEGNDGIGRYWLIPGSPTRAEQIAEEHFTSIARRVVPRRAELSSYLGTLETENGVISVGTIGSGMGCPSIAIVLNELIDIGGRRFVRVGTAGSLQTKIETGDVVIATGAVREEGTTRKYVPLEFPAIAHPDVVMALERAAIGKVLESLTTYRGIVHTKDDFNSEIPDCRSPMQPEVRRYWETLRDSRVLATSMEEAALFVISHVRSENPVLSLTEERKGLHPDVIKSGSVLAVIGHGKHPLHPDEDLRHIAEKRACQIGVGGVEELYKIDFGKG